MQTAQEIKPLFVRRSQLKQVVGLSPSSCWRLEQSGHFPKRRQIGHTVGWIYSELEEFISKANLADGITEG